MNTILLADDDQNDVFLTQFLFRECNVLNPFQVVSNGDEAIKYLSGEGIYADRHHYPLPVLCLLDLRMPGKGGMDVLKWLLTQPKPDFALIILTAFEDLRQMREAYQLGAQSFLTKPLRKPDVFSLTSQVKGLQIGKGKYSASSRN